MTLFDNKICCHWMFFFANGLMVISFIARQSLWGIVSSYLANVNSIFIWCWGLTSNNFYWEDFFEKGIYWGVNCVCNKFKGQSLNSYFPLFADCSLISPHRCIYNPTLALWGGVGFLRMTRGQVSAMIH